MWKDFDRIAYTRAAFAAHVAGLVWTQFSSTEKKPIGITLHNTAGPTLAEWVESGPSHDARILSLQKYYEGLGWHAGPHLFISRDFINGFTPLTEWGIHSTCFNHTHIGIEMVGDYTAEIFDSGDGAKVRDNAVFALAVLMLKLGLTPEHNLVFHKDCPQDHHDCPGHNVLKPDIIARVRAQMTTLSAARPVALPGVRFGKKPARPEAQPKLKFSTYAIALPEPPTAFSYDNLLPADAGMLGNDALGDCVIAGAEHETMLWTKFSGALAIFSDATAITDYSLIAGYDPADPSSDQGTDMQAAAAYRRKTGICDVIGDLHKVAGYVSIARGDLAQHKLAAWLFGAVGVGISVSRAQVDQFDRGEPWSGTLGADAGGHYVPLIGFDKDGYLLVVTWGRVQRITPEFFVANNDESIAYFSEEFLKAGLNPVGFNTTQLQADLAAITSAKGVSSMPDIPVTPTILVAQITAGKEAAASMIKANVPGWEQRMIPQAAIDKVVEAVVIAANSVRDNPPAA